MKRFELETMSQVSQLDIELASAFSGAQFRHVTQFITWL